MYRPATIHHCVYEYVDRIAPQTVDQGRINHLSRHDRDLVLGFWVAPEVPLNLSGDFTHLEGWVELPPASEGAEPGNGEPRRVEISLRQTSPTRMTGTIGETSCDVERTTLFLLHPTHEGLEVKQVEVPRETIIGLKDLDHLERRALAAEFGMWGASHPTEAGD